MNETPTRSGLLALLACLACGPSAFDEPPVSPSPRKLGGLGPAREAAAGGFHSMVVTGSVEPGGSLVAWGHNLHGQLGLGAGAVAEVVWEPSPVSAAAGWRAVSSGGLHTLAIDDEGRLFAWGYNELGQLGLGDSGAGSDRHVPARVGGDSDWVQVAAGGEHSLALKSDGTLWAFGKNGSGQLGIGGSRPLSAAPVRVGESAAWVEVLAGAHHSMALTADGHLYAWGGNRYGQLGLGRSGPSALERSPVRVEGSWLAVSGGGYHTIALDRDGSLWAWGRSDRGQAGIFTRESSPVTTPSPVGRGEDWVDVSAGYFHSVALRSDGTLWAFGDNEFGQLGTGRHGAGEGSQVPVAVDSPLPWRSVSAGFFHTLAVSGDGLHAWGRDELGQLGVEPGGRR